MRIMPGKSLRSGPTGLTVSAKEARNLILDGQARAGLQVGGHLDLSNQCVVELPPGLVVDSLDLSGCIALRTLPADLKVRRLKLTGCRALGQLPAGLHCYELDLSHTALRSLPDDLQVVFRLDLEGCTQLERLPDGLRVGSLVLRDCTALCVLPEGLDVYFLDLTGCTGLTDWPQEGSVRVGFLSARGCTQLRALPHWLTGMSQLDVSGCENLAALPEGLTVSSWVDVADTAIRSLPHSLQGARLRWHGVPIEARIAFQPETITAGEVLGERNVELRRVLLERMGYEAFLQQAEARQLDRDRDPGGERRLLRVPIEGDEDLVCLSVFCPSTGRQYVLRVPPTMRNCRQAAAWIAGFDKVDEYQPIAET